MFRADGRSSVVVDVLLVNGGPRAVRIRGASASFLSGEQILATRPFERAFFDDPVFRRPVRVDPGQTIEWGAVCLEAVPERADALRLDVRHVRPRRRESVVRVHVTLDSAGEPVPLRLPFHGYWRVTQGHGCSTRHRVGGRGGDFAWDFAAVGPTGRLVLPEYDVSGRNRDAYAFGQPILAPVGGRVVRSFDGTEDNEGLDRYPRRSMVEERENPEWIFGNFVVIDAGDRRFVLLAHLMRGSVRVAAGDEVAAGDVLARCGNSGNTVEPHVHVQVMDGPFAGDDSVRGVPGLFLDYTEIAVTANGTPVARRVQRGDPPERSLIAPSSGR